MNHRTRGVCCMINNINFRAQKKRKGADKDTQGIVNVFTKLGFDCETYVDKTKDVSRVRT